MTIFRSAARLVKYIHAIETRPDFAKSSDSKVFGFTRSYGSKLFADSKISTQESGLPVTCGRKANPERKSCGFKNIRIRVHGVSA